MIDNIYIVHYEPLKDRKEYLDSFLNKINIPFEFYLVNEKFDKNILENIDVHYKFNPTILNRKLNVGELSVSVAHIEIYKKILENDYQFCLIVEDDAVFEDNFLEVLPKIMGETNDYDFTFLSTCCNLRKNKNGDKLLYESETSRCVSGYVVKKTKLNDVIKSSIPISTPIDTHLNVIKKELNLKYAWCEPPIIIQGSETKYKSNLR
jgi:hypothetical protein